MHHDFSALMQFNGGLFINQILYDNTHSHLKDLINVIIAFIITVNNG